MRAELKKMEEGQRRDEAAETQTGLGLCERKIKYSHHKNNDRTLNYSKECVASCCVCVYVLMLLAHLK